MRKPALKRQAKNAAAPKRTDNTRSLERRFVAWRIPQMCSLIGEHRPNVVCLQETKIGDEKFPCEELTKLGYSFEFLGEKTHNGVAILSETAIASAQNEFTEEDEGSPARRFIEVQVGSTYILNACIPNAQCVVALIARDKEAANRPRWQPVPFP